MEYSRKQFFKVFARDLLNSLAPEEPVQPLQEDSTPEEIREERKPFIIRPPGASPVETLIRSCSTCERECARACPQNAIFFLNEEFGIEEGTPFMNPNLHPCRWCTDMPCIEACPTGALSAEVDDPVEPIAKAEINMELCATSQGVFCDYCAHYCPTHIKAITMINRKPVLDAQKCTGCGMCVYHCDQVPNAIAMLPP